LLKDPTYPKIIYYHCTWGKDRTGALTFGWLVKHGGYSKDNAIASVDSVFVPNEHYSAMIEDYYKWLFP
jgi:protein-tyrosine phosphatase